MLAGIGTLLIVHLRGGIAWTWYTLLGALVTIACAAVLSLLSGRAPLPDDGDPTREDRSFAVTQAMEEIERSQGVTIVEIEPEAQEALAREVAATTHAGEIGETEETGADEDEAGDEDEIDEASAADTGDAEQAPDESAESDGHSELPDRSSDTDPGNDDPAGGRSGSYDWRGRPIG